MANEPLHPDFYAALTESAARLDAVCIPDENAEVFYELMSGGLVWRDETTLKFSTQFVGCLRALFAYRTSLMLGRHEEAFAPLWNQALKLAPNWIGFLPTRRQPTPELLAIYRRGNISLKKCTRDIKNGKVSLEDFLLSDGLTGDRN